MRLGAYSAAQLRFVYRVVARANSTRMWGQMQEEPLEIVLKDVIKAALIARPPFVPDRFKGVVDPLDLAVDHIINELAATGFLPLNEAYADASLNVHAVSYTMKNMRTRLLKHINGGGRDLEAEAAAIQSITLDFFRDLDEQGWRLIRTYRSTVAHGSTFVPGKQRI